MNLSSTTMMGSSVLHLSNVQKYRKWWALWEAQKDICNRVPCLVNFSMNPSTSWNRTYVMPLEASCCPKLPRKRIACTVWPFNPLPGDQYCLRFLEKTYFTVDVAIRVPNCDEMLSEFDDFLKKKAQWSYSSSVKNPARKIEPAIKE